MYWKSAQMNFYKKSGVGSALLVQLDGQMPEPLIVERATGTITTLFCIMAATIGVF